MLEDMDTLFAQSTTKTVILQMRGQKFGGGNAVAEELERENEKDLEIEKQQFAVVERTKKHCRHDHSIVLNICRHAKNPKHLLPRCRRCGHVSYVPE